MERPQLSHAAPLPSPKSDPEGDDDASAHSQAAPVAEGVGSDPVSEPDSGLSAAARLSFARTGLLVFGSLGADVCQAAKARVLAQIAANADAQPQQTRHLPDATGSPTREEPSPAAARFSVAASPPAAARAQLPAPVLVPVQFHPTPPPSLSPSGKGVSALRQSIARRHMRRVVRAMHRTGGSPPGMVQHRGALLPPPPAPITLQQHRAAGMLMTAHERRVVLQQRTLMILASLSNGLALSATMHIKLGLVGNSAGRIATSTGQQLALISLCNLLLGPVVAAASDRFGRLPFMYLPVIGRLGWSASLFAVGSIHRYQEWGVVAFGIFGAGAGAVQHAAFDDLFSARPALNAQVQARNSAWTSSVGLIAPILGAEIGRRSLRLALVASAVVGALQIPLMLLGKETLHPSQRKPFQLAKADPLRNLSVLFRNGPELRRLALANLLLQGSAWSQQTMQAFQIGSLGWTPADQSYYGSFQSLLGIMSQGSVVMPLLSRLGSKRAYEIGSLFSAMGLLLTSQAGRPLGASKLRKTVQLAIALLTMVPGHVCGLAMRTMIVKQADDQYGKHLATGGAVGSAPLGRGELNAALNGLRSLLSVAMPLAWGWLCNFCMERDGTTWWCAPGAQFILAAALRLLSRQLVLGLPT